MNTAFADIPADAYPVKIEFIDGDTGEVWHVINVSGPGVVQIPSCHDYGINRTGVRFTYGNGVVHEEPAPEQET